MRDPDHDEDLDMTRMFINAEGIEVRRTRGT